MARRFRRGFNYISENAPVDDTPKKTYKSDELLILILLFILLAASPSLGLNGRYFFIIIMAVIGLGGIDKAFGLNQ